MNKLNLSPFQYLSNFTTWTLNQVQASYNGSDLESSITKLQGVFQSINQTQIDIPSNISQIIPLESSTEAVNATSSIFFDVPLLTLKAKNIFTQTIQTLSESPISPLSSIIASQHISLSIQNTPKAQLISLAAIIGAVAGWLFLESSEEGLALGNLTGFSYQVATQVDIVQKLEKVVIRGILGFSKLAGISVLTAIIYPRFPDLFENTWANSGTKFCVSCVAYSALTLLFKSTVKAVAPSLPQGQGNPT